MIFILLINSPILFDNDFLSLHIVSVDDSQNINSGDQSARADAVGALVGGEHAASEVDDLQHAVAGYTSEDDLSVADEGEVIVPFTAEVGVVGHEHQAEAAFVVVIACCEGVARRLQQVHVGAGEVVDEVQIA